MATYALKLMFEWRSGALWCDDAAAREAFGVGPIDDVLPLSDGLRERLDALGAWHDTALDWDDPAGPSPWSDAESARFEAAAAEALERVRAELGPAFEVRYRPL